MKQSDGHGGGMGGHDDDISPLTEQELSSVEQAEAMGDYGQGSEDIARLCEEVRWSRAKLRTRDIEVETYYHSFALTKEAYNRLRKTFDAVREHVITFYRADTTIVDLINNAIMTEKECTLFKPEQQHDASALVYLRECVLTLREQRDAHGDKTNKYDPLVRAAWNARDLFEWLYPYVWVNDPEFVPFKERGPDNEWGWKR